MPPEGDKYTNHMWEREPTFLKIWRFDRGADEAPPKDFFCGCVEWLLPGKSAQYLGEAITLEFLLPRWCRL